MTRRVCSSSTTAWGARNGVRTDSRVWARTETRKRISAGSIAAFGCEVPGIRLTFLSGHFQSEEFDEEPSRPPGVHRHRVHGVRPAGAGAESPPEPAFRRDARSLDFQRRD